MGKKAFLDDTQEYQVHFNPAVTRSVSVERRGEEVTVFQGDLHSFPDGKAAHPKRYTIRIQGGEHGRQVRLTVDDPQFEVESVTVRLYPKGRQPGAEETPEPVETVRLAAGIPTCPPNCVRHPT